MPHGTISFRMLQGAQLSNTNQKTNGRKKAFVAVGRPFRVMGYRGHTSHEHRTPQVRPWHPAPHQDATPRRRNIPPPPRLCSCLDGFAQSRGYQLSARPSGQGSDSSSSSASGRGERQCLCSVKSDRCWRRGDRPDWWGALLRGACVTQEAAACRVAWCGGEGRGGVECVAWCG